MKTAIIIHGMPSLEEYRDEHRPASSNCHRIPWLQRQMTLRNTCAQTPEMPLPYRPDYQYRKQVFVGLPLDENTILVGHSCGGGFILRYLSEEQVKVGKVVLVAPWIDPTHELDTGMFDFILDTDVVAKTQGITIFQSTNDIEEVQKSIAIITNTVNNIKIVTFQDYGHFCLDDMKTESFPELLYECIN